MTHRFNVIRDTYDPRDCRVAMPSAYEVANLPTSFDLRGRTNPNNGIPIMPDPYDQGQEGSCTANGNGGIFDIQRRVQGFLPFMPSRRFIYRAEQASEGDVGVDNGAQVRTGIKVMAALGVPPEADWPYISENFSTLPPKSVFDTAAKTKVTKYESVTAVPQAVCAMLASGRPIVFGFTVYSRFEGSQIAKDGILHMPQKDESVMGGHCVVAVGYVITQSGGKHGGLFGPLLDRLFGENQLDGYLIVRNSWGKDWGQGGYFTMPFGYLTHNLASDFWVVDTVNA